MNIANGRIIYRENIQQISCLRVKYCPLVYTGIIPLNTSRAIGIYVEQMTHDWSGRHKSQW